MRTLQFLVLVSLFFGGILPVAGQVVRSQSGHSSDLRSGELRIKVVDPQSAVPQKCPEVGKLRLS